MYDALKTKLFLMRGKVVERLVKSSLQLVPESVKEMRYSICLSCDKLHKEIDRCTVCGCHMSAKTLLPSSECPIGKWKTFEKNEEII